MLFVGLIIKGWWLDVWEGKVSGYDQLISYFLYLYVFKMNGEYFVVLVEIFEWKYGVMFEGICDGVLIFDVD